MTALEAAVPAPNAGPAAELAREADRIHRILFGVAASEELKRRYAAAIASVPADVTQHGALTFDAGANADGVPSIRATLLRTGVRATFFLTGNFARTYPAKSRRLADRDLIGNHTMSHPDLTTLSDRAVTAQVRDAEAEIRSVTGEDPRRFFRFPYGARDQHLVGVLNGLCYVPFRWTVDSLGWKGTSGGMTVHAVADRVVAAAAPGAIVLMHVGSNPDDGTMLDAAALPSVVDRLRAKGYTFVRLSRVMSAAP